MATLTAQITAAGITAPSYADVLLGLQQAFLDIYGDDAYLGADSKDGQLLAVFARALHDCNMTAVAVYNSFSPSTAQGNRLSSLVQLNGLQRRSATRSQVNVVLAGTAGTVLTSAKVRDADGNTWALPASVTIPPSGTITVTGTCDAAGAITAPANSVTIIATPTRGWASVYNPEPALPGTEAETDAELRLRQRNSVGIPAQTVLASLLGALQNVPGVVQAAVYENDTGTTSAEGIPAHSIAAVVAGGDSVLIANTIQRYKTPGAYTHGTTAVVVHDTLGAEQTIRYFTPTPLPVYVTVDLHAFAGYSTTTAAQIQQSVADYVNGLGFGADVLYTRLFPPALLYGAQGSLVYQVTALALGTAPSPTGVADVPVAYNQRATCTPADVVINVV